ncbi:TnsA endonuclease N-terminal domain-containing protein [Deferrisoma palaeochoriense]
MTTISPRPGRVKGPLRLDAAPCALDTAGWVHAPPDPHRLEGPRDILVPAAVARRLNQGYGIGATGSYRPWLLKHHVPSTGRRRTLRGVRVERIHHLLSDLEYRAFLLLESHPRVLDIREQYPLIDVRLIQAIAACLGIRAPTFLARNTRQRPPYLPTLDLLVTLTDRSTLLAISVKPAAQLTRQRVAELQELERQYCHHHGVAWRIITDRDLAAYGYRCHTLHWCRVDAVLDPSHRVTECEYERYLYSILKYRLDSGTPLRDVLLSAAATCTLSEPQAVSLARHAIWHGHLPLDLSRRVGLLYPLPWASSAGND